MPKREDEYWAAKKEPRGKALCPFCGSPKVYYSKHFKSWRCGRCEKSFSMPSYGPGGDFDDKGTRPRSSSLKIPHAVRQVKHKPKRNWRIRLGSFSFRKLFLDALVLVCLAVASVSGYRLFYEHSIDVVWGIVVFLVSIGVLFWNILLLRGSGFAHKRPSFKLFFFSLLVIVLVLAFAGVQPLAGYKDAMVDKVSSWVERGQEIILPAGPHGTYTATMLGFEQTLTVGNDTLTFYNLFDGKRVYNYEFKTGNWNWTSHGDYRSGIVELSYLTPRGWVVLQERFLYQADIDALTIGDTIYYK